MYRHAWILESATSHASVAWASLHTYRYTVAKLEGAKLPLLVVHGCLMLKLEGVYVVKINQL
jgi:hypothetical protein